MVVDYEESKGMFQDDSNTVLPGIWHELPVTKKGTDHDPID